MAAIPVIDSPTLEAVCAVLGDTETGLTGSEIGRHLRECGIEDASPTAAKRHRLFEALSARQGRDRCANNVLRFITHVMSPVRYTGNRECYERELEKLNTVLSFSGLIVGDDGKLRQIAAANTLSQAEARASALRRALIERKVHPDVLAFCRAELLAQDYFHAVFEATKSIADKLRRLTGLNSDGAKLADEALSIGSAGHPRLAFNSLATESERSEHNGLVNIIKGLFGAFRNTAAHAPRIHWLVSEQDALDILTTLSLVHRRLDGAVRTHVP